MNESRVEFIKLFKFFDDYYFEHKEVIEVFMKKGNFKTFKECAEHHNSSIVPLSNVNIGSIEQITLSNNLSMNPFQLIYPLKKEVLLGVFYQIAHTHKALSYYNKYSEPYRDLKDSKYKQTNINKINNTIELLKNIDSCSKEHTKAIQYLENIIGSLDNKHYTKRQVYQDFLHGVNERLVKIDGFTKTNIFKFVNGVIKNYFNEEDISFSIKTNIQNFNSHHYIYENQGGIVLYHS